VGRECRSLQSPRDRYEDDGNVVGRSELVSGSNGGNQRRCQLLAARATTMSVQLYQAQYFGGPCDGCLVVGTTFRSDDTWSISFSTANGQSGSSRPSSKDACRAVYRLRGTRRFRDLGVPAICYEYEFVGFEIAAPKEPQDSRSWLTRLASNLRPILQSLRERRLSWARGRCAVRPTSCRFQRSAAAGAERP
jgi:hypothetical protein